jgi:hypothetical protein
MLAASVGLKLCDAVRRILMYTKPMHSNKGFYALCRGIFPIHELCGTMTAIGLAKRDLLGVDLPLWKVLLPAIVVHGMANFRGMKPIFKWNSATPWSEMQLSPLAMPDSSTLPQLIKKGYAKLMWVSQRMVRLLIYRRCDSLTPFSSNSMMHTIADTAQSSPRILHQELLHGKSPGLEANYNLCWQPRSLFSGACHNGNAQKEVVSLPQSELLERFVPVDEAYYQIACRKRFGIFRLMNLPQISQGRFQKGNLYLLLLAVLENRKSHMLRCIPKQKIILA